ncbi:MAG: hypothetical protein KDA92_11735 [Planctomycetales bacterium]|nr:hypothetical protein [Planctomycetales bacterium]
MDHKFAQRLCSPFSVLLICLTVSATEAQEPVASLQSVDAAVAAGSAQAGAELMRAVVDQIEQHQTISAKVRHRANLYDQKLVGSGVYLQRESEQGTQIHFALSVKAGERLVSLLHVTDGRFLYLRDNLDDRLKVGRVDLQRLRRAGAGEDAALSPAAWMTGGGLPQLLRSLATNFEIAPPQAAVLQGVPVWALSCTWSPTRLVEIWPQANQFVDESGRLVAERLPEQFPDRIFVLVGQDDLFPYRIDYRRGKQVDGIGRLAGDASASRSIATMELFEVQFNAPLDPLLFAYRPGNDEKLEDRTDDYLARLKRHALPVKQTASAPSDEIRN